MQAGALEVYAVMTAAGSHVSTGQLVDIAMAKSRLALQHGDFALARTLIAEGKACVCAAHTPRRTCAALA